MRHLTQFMSQSGIHTRDGFGFSETTQISFNASGSYVCIRISIGTESVDVIAKQIHEMCRYLLVINEVMDKYRLSRSRDSLPPLYKLSELIMRDVEQETWDLALNGSNLKLGQAATPSNLQLYSIFSAHPPTGQENQQKCIPGIERIIPLKNVA